VLKEVHYRSVVAIVGSPRILSMSTAGQTAEHPRCRAGLPSLIRISPHRGGGSRFRPTPPDVLSDSAVRESVRPGRLRRGDCLRDGLLVRVLLVSVKQGIRAIAMKSARGFGAIVMAAIGPTPPTWCCSKSAAISVHLS